MESRKILKIVYRYSLFLLIVLLSLGLSSLLLNRQAMINYGDQNYFHAITKLELALRINPFFFPAYFNLGNCYLDIDNYPLAIEAYRKSIAINPNYFTAYENLAIVYSVQQEYQKSFAVLEEAKKRGGFSDSMASLYQEIHNLYSMQMMAEGIKLLNNKNFGHTIKKLKKTILLSPKFAPAHHNLGLVYFLQKDFKNAETYLKKSIQLNPHDASAFSMLGEIMFQEKDFNMAIIYYGRAAALTPDDAKIHNNLSFAYYLIDNYDHAITHMRKAFSIEPSNATYWHTLASMLRDNGEYDEALTHFRTIAKKHPDIIELHNDIAGIYFLYGWVDEARKELDEEIRQRKKKLSKNPNDIDSLLVLAKAHKNKAEYAKSKIVLSEILKRAPQLKEQVFQMTEVLESIMLTSRNKQQAQQRELKKPEQGIASGNDIVYLKNGRRIIGRIVHQDKEKIILEIMFPDTVGTVTLNKQLISKIEPDD